VYSKDILDESWRDENDTEFEWEWAAAAAAIM
jgi:hypothetical protein